MDPSRALTLLTPVKIFIASILVFSAVLCRKLILSSHEHKILRKTSIRLWWWFKHPSRRSNFKHRSTGFHFARIFSAENMKVKPPVKFHLSNGISRCCLSTSCRFPDVMFFKFHFGNSYAALPFCGRHVRCLSMKALRKFMEYRVTNDIRLMACELGRLRYLWGFLARNFIIFKLTTIPK